MALDLPATMNTKNFPEPLASLLRRIVRAAFLSLWLGVSTSHAATQLWITNNATPPSGNDNLKVAFDKVNTNFLNLFSAGSSGILFSDLNTNFFRTNLTSGGKVGVQTNKTLPFWVNPRDPPYSATGDGVTDDTAAIQSALNLANTNGGTVYLPRGQYSVTGLTLTNDRVRLTGDGYSSILIRRTDSSSNLLTVTAQQFQMDNLRVQASLAFTNVGKQVVITNVSDSIVSGCWFFGGYDQLVYTYGNNHRTANNIFEGSGHHAIWQYQNFLNLISGNAFYQTGFLVDDGNTNNTAAIFLENDPAYSFPPYGFTITGNVFRKSLFAHGINATNVANLSIVGNYFNLSGTFNAGSKDDMKLSGVTNAIVSGNTSSALFNDYDPASRATRWVVNIGSTSSKVRVIGNSFVPGINGTVNDQASNTEYISEQGHLFQTNLTVMASVIATNSMRFGPSLSTNSSLYESLGQSVWQTFGKGYSLFDAHNNRLNLVSTTNGDWVMRGTLSVTGIVAANTMRVTNLAGTKLVTSDSAGNLTPVTPSGNTNHFLNGNLAFSLVAPAAIVTNGAASGQVLKFNGTVYAPANDDAGAGSSVFVDAVSVTNPNLDSDTNILWFLREATNIVGVVTNVSSSQIVDGTIIDADISAGGITTRSKLPAAIAYEDEANTFTASQTFTNGFLKVGWLDLGSGTNLNYAASARFYKLLTATNTIWTTSNESDGIAFRLLTETPTNGHTQTFPTNWIWLETGTTNAPAFTTSEGAVSEIEVERRNGTNYARLIGDINVPLRVNQPAGGVLVSRGSGQPTEASVTAATNVFLAGAGDGVNPEWRKIFDADISAGGITTRSKLPSAIAYEDEINTFTLAQTFSGPVAYTPINNATALNWNSGPSYSYSTNASFGITFAGSPTAGAFLDYFVTNTATTNIVVTNLSTQVYSMEDQALVDAVTIPGNTNVSRLFWRYTGAYYQLSVQTKGSAVLKKIHTTGTVDWPVKKDDTTSYTVVATNKGQLITLTNASAVTVTLPQATNDFGAGWFASFQNLGSSTVTLTPTTSLIDSAATLALTQGQGVIVHSDGTNYFTMRGIGQASAPSSGVTNIASYFVSNRVEVIMATGSSTFQLGTADITTVGTASFVMETATVPANTSFDSTTATNNTAGIEGIANKDFGRPYDVEFITSIEQTNALRFFVGLSSTVGATMVQSTNPAGDWIGFALDTHAGRLDTQWQCVNKDNTTMFISSSGVNAVTNFTKFRLIGNASSNVWYINNTSVKTNTANLPRSGQKGGYVAKVSNGTNNTARTIFFNRYSYTSPNPTPAP